ncbi:hypothetical protein HAV_00944 [Candidatus Hepatincola sp. Av]
MKTIHYFFIIFFISISFSYAITYNDLLEETGHVSNERKTLDDVEKEHKNTKSSIDWFTQSKLYLSIGGSYTPKVGYDQDWLAENIHNQIPNLSSVTGSVVSKPSIGANLAVGFSPFNGNILRSFRTELRYSRSFYNENTLQADEADYSSDYYKFGAVEFYDIFLWKYLYLSFGFGASRSIDETSIDYQSQSYDESYKTTQLSGHIQLSLFKGYMYVEYARYYDLDNNKLAEDRIDLGLRLPLG